MAFYPMNPTLPEAAEFLNLLARVSTDLQQLELIHSAMIAKRNGADGSSDTHYALHVERYGYPDTATARASFNEFASAVGNGFAAILQCASFHKQ